jgi:hypothetical protein
MDIEIKHPAGKLGASLRQDMHRPKLQGTGERLDLGASEPGNIATRFQSVGGENSANQPKILPAVLVKIVGWCGFPGDDRTDF